jgi:hypothetical protein
MSHSVTALGRRDEGANTPYKEQFVTVAPDVNLQVMDWGGTGETMVLLTGLGDNAHVYSQFAF